MGCFNIVISQGILNSIIRICKRLSMQFIDYAELHAGQYFDKRPRRCCIDHFRRKSNCGLIEDKKKRLLM